ncbi:MAG: ribonuclease Z [Candidatus Lokiarchaeota archaeon]|nr:ribonuclease Z [Candidatus Lokiarchaeota archaeon]
MELIILGSAAATPIKERNLSSIALRFRNQIFIFDCGEDFQRKFAEAGLKFNKPMKIFITHFHGDHLLGLPPFLFRMSLNDRTAPMMIFGPRNLFLYLYLHKKILGLKANYPLKIIEIDHQTQELIEFDGLDSEIPRNTIKMNDNIVLDSKYFSIKYALVEHSVITFAYAFIEKPRYGKFNPDHARDLGIPESNLWKKLQEGQIIDFNGQIIDPVKEGIVGPKRPGRKITYSGDLAPSESLIKLGIDSDIIIHEATFSKRLTETAKEKKHSTSVDAAYDAKKMGAKQLILTHISARYQSDALILLEEAKEIFPNTILAEDLLKIELK